MFYKKGVLRNFTKFTGKHLCQSLFFNKVAGLRHRCFLVNFVKFLRAPFLQNPSGRLVLNIVKYKFELFGIESNIVNIATSIWNSTKVSLFYNRQVSTPFNTSMGIKQGGILGLFITYRKLRLNKRGDWRRQTAEMKCDTEQTMKLE